MKSRYFALFFLSLFGLFTQPKAQALPPAKPTDGSVRFTRVSLNNFQNTFHSYHLRWKDNAPDADGTELQLRFANAGSFYFLTNGSPTPISDGDAQGYREAIVSVGSPPPGTICQFQVVTWKFNGSKTESSSLLIQTRVPAPPVPTVPPTNNTFLAPANLRAQLNPNNPSDDGHIEISWEDKSDIEAFHQLYVGEVVNGSVPIYNDVGLIPFGKTKEILSNEIFLPFSGTTQQRPNIIPGKTYRVALRAIKKGASPTIALSIAAPPAVPLTTDFVTQAAISNDFPMPSLNGPDNLTGSVTSENTILLNWTDKSNNETGYEVQYRPVTGGVPPEFTTYGTTSANVTSATVPIGLFSTAEFRVCAIYAYQAVATNPAVTTIRSAYSNAPQLSTITFLPPTDVTAKTSETANTIDLTWVDNTTTEVGFDIFCRPSGSTAAYNRCVSVRENVTTARVKAFTASNNSSGIPIFTDLILGTNYDFIVRAVGEAESVSSADSNVATAAPQQGFSSKMNASIPLGASSSYSVTTSIPATSITATGLPPGMQITPSTGVISGTATEMGRFPVILNATFSSAPSVSGTLVLLVEPTAGAPISLNSIPSTTIRINEPLIIPLNDKFVDLDTGRAARWETTHGNVDILLSPKLTPQAVDNFMAYVNGGDYTNVIFHRHVANFVLQAGGYRALTPTEATKETAPALNRETIIDVNKRNSPKNEPGISNLQWTIAAAKLGPRKSIATLTNSTKVDRDESFGYLGNPDSATTDIFINLGNNSSNLDNQNSGFTVFGRVSILTQPTITAIRQLDVGDYSVEPFSNSFGDLFKQLPVSLTPAPAIPKYKELVRINRAIEIAPLTFSVNNLSTNVASVTLVNNQLIIYGITEGTRSVTVTARDLENNTATQTFAITVNDSYFPPIITSQPASQALALGAPASLRVTATGSNLSYSWRKNGVEMSPPQTNSTVNFASFSASDIGEYDVIISNSHSTLPSQKATLSQQAPANITSTLPSRLVEVGKPLEIEANITGSPSPLCVWRRGTTVISGQTSRKFAISSAKLSDAGSYTVTASNAGGSSSPGTGGTATVIVIDKSTQYQNVKVSTPVKLTAPVSGPGLTYQWKKGGLDIGSSEPGFSGQQDATLSISNVTTGNVGDYICVIEAPAGLGSAETGIIRLSVPTQKPILASFILRNADVGRFYRHQIELAAGSSQSGAPGKFVVSGLPAGLSCDVNTGLITGIPRASGIFSVRATVSNAVGSIISPASTLRVSPLEAATSGSYVASISPSQSLNLNLGGRLDVTLTDNSAFTATLQLAGETLRSAGVLNINSITGGITYAGIVNFPRPNRKTIQATLILQPTSTFSDQSILQGSITDGTSLAAINGYRHAWSLQFKSGPFGGISFAAPTGGFKSSVIFNIALDPEVTRLGQRDTPEGSGYMALTVTNGGAATMAGRLSDGTPLTASTLISSAAEMYVFQSLNLNTASLGGFMRLSTTNYSQLSSNLRWVKGRQPLAERTYQPGFSPTILSAYGAGYNAPPDKNVLKISDIEKNTLIKFSRGGLNPADPSLSVKLGQTGGVIYPAVNPSKVSLTISPNTGLFNGSFELDGTEKRKATYQGLIIPKNIADPSNSTITLIKPSTGVGHFLLPELTPTVATSAIKSGLVSMNGILITEQPTSANILKGANVTFSVKALIIADLTALTYQWQKNGIPLTNRAKVDGVNSGISGATTASLALTDVYDADAGDYTCIIKSGTEVQAISTVAKLTIIVSDVELSRATPADPNVALNTPITLSVAANGTAKSYQWYKNNVLISGAKSSTYSFNSGTTANTTNYSVRVSNSATPAGVLSNSLPVTVIDGVRNVVISRIAPTTNFVVISSPVTLSVSAYGEALTYQWKDGNGDNIVGATSPTYRFTARATFGTETFTVVVKNPLTLTGITSSTLTVNVIVPISGVVVSRTDPLDTNVPLNTSVTLSAVAIGTSPTYQWYRGTTLIAGATSATYSFNSGTTANTANYSVRVSNSATPTGVLSNSLPITVIDGVRNVVISRIVPTTSSVATNSPVTLTVSAYGESLTYQWRSSAGDIMGATGKTHTFTSQMVRGDETFTVVVKNPLTLTGITSSTLTVNVIDPISGISITKTSPTGAVGLNTPVTLNVTAAGTAPTYQWLRGTTVIPGATGANYSFNSATTAGTTNYFVRVNNPATTAAGVLSAAFPVTTVSPLSNVQLRRTTPTTASVATGAPVTLTASASGSSLSYVWYKDNVVIADATNPTYTFTEAATSSPKFKVKVSNPLLTAGLESSELTVNVITPVSGVVASRTAPSGGTVPRNVSVTLSVTASGTSPTYQWYRGTILIAGATSATYVFNSGTSASTLSYNVRVTNAAMATAVTSNSVPVQVAP